MSHLLLVVSYDGSREERAAVPRGRSDIGHAAELSGLAARYIEAHVRAWGVYDFHVDGSDHMYRVRRAA